MVVVKRIRKPLPEDLRKRGAFPLILHILHCGGMLVDKSEKMNFGKLLAHTLGKCFTVACLTIASVGFLVEAWREMGNLQDFLECLKFVLKQSRNVIKVSTVLVSKNKILNLMKTVEENFFIHDKDLSTEETAITRKCLENARRFAYIYWIQWCLVLAFEASVTAETHEVNNQNYTEKNLKEMPTKIWVPFPTHRSPLYQIGVVYNVLFVIAGSWFSAVTDTLIFTFLFYMTSQFEILGNSIKNMTKDVAIEISSKQAAGEMNILEDKQNFFGSQLDGDGEFRFQEFATGDTNEIQKEQALTCTEMLDYGPTYNREIEMHLARCIIYHQQLYENVELLKSILSPIEALELLSASVLIAISGFNVTFSDDPGNIFRNSTFLIYIILGLGLHCWLADRLTNQSLQVYHDAYSSLWYNQTAGVKKAITMIIMRAQCPVILRAGPFFPLSLETFGKIMQTSYSYLTLLTQVYEK